MTRNRPQLALALAAALAAAALATATRADGSISRRVSDRLVVRLHGAPDQEALLASFIAALESDPQFPGLTVEPMDALPAHRIHLLALSAPEDVDLDELEIGEEYGAWLEWGEATWEHDAPEGTTGSTWVDAVDVGAPDYFEQYAAARLGLAAAQAHSTGRGVIVAVLDTGIDATHPALADRIVPGGRDFIDGDDDPSDAPGVEDLDGDGLVGEMAGHGTFVAGLVALVAPEARLLPERVLNADGVGETWTLVSGIFHAVDRGADVITMSLRCTTESKAVEEAIKEARRHGIACIAAAGNLNRSHPRVYPAMTDLAIGVAAVDDDDRKAGFSNFHNELQLSAPGANHGDEPDGLPLPSRSIVSTLPGGDFAIWDGTSMAAPLVAGVAALVRAQHPNWAFDEDTADAVGSALRDHAVDIDDLNPAHAGKLGAGRVDAAATVLAGPDMPAPGDVDGDGTVDLDDVLRVLGAWHDVHSSADLDASGLVDFGDLLVVLMHWS